MRLAIAAAVMLVACGPMTVSGPAPLSSRVVDAVTRRPIAGAVVRLERRFECSGLHGTHTYQEPPDETITDADGKFTIGSLPPKIPCRRHDRWDNHYVVAPGYLPSRAFWPSETPLEPVRYLTERDAYRLDPTRPNAPPQSLYARTVAAAEGKSFTPAGRPGVFVSHPGATFERIAVVRVAFGVKEPGFTVLAQNVPTGTIHVWTTQGKSLAPIPPPAGMMLVPGVGPGGYPLLQQGGQLWLSRSFDASLRAVTPPDWQPLRARFGDVRGGASAHGQLVTVEAAGRQLATYRERAFYQPPGDSVSGPAGDVPIGEVMAGATPPLECLAFRRPRPTYGIVEAPKSVLIVAHTAGGRALFEAPLGDISPALWRATRVEIPPGALTGEVTACAASRRALYLAIRNQGLRKLDFVGDPTQGINARAVRLSKALQPGNGLPETYSSLAVASMRPIDDAEWEAVYAVALDDAVYRFTLDLVPDQRIKRAAERR